MKRALWSDRSVIPTLEVEAESGAQGQLQLLSDFQANLDYKYTRINKTKKA